MTNALTRTPDLYKNVTQPTRYGNDDTSYKLAAEFLDAVPGEVRDWGCGTCYAQQFIKSPYQGMDGCDSEFCDFHVDLALFKTSTPKALMRHVLEHNWDWKEILENMLNCFTIRAVLILFIPLAHEEENLSLNGDFNWPTLALRGSDFNSILAAHKEITVRYEKIETQTPPFNFEGIYYLSKEVPSHD